MPPRAPWCLLVLVGVAGPAAGQTRMFLGAECTFTLPGKDWEWVAAPAGDPAALAAARSYNGQTLTLRCQPLGPDDLPGRAAYARFEEELLAAGGLDKLDAKRLTFKDAPAYQVDVHSAAAGRATRVRAVYANQRRYELHVGNPGDSVGSDAEAVFRGFEFRGPPRTAEPPDDDDLPGTPRKAGRRRGVWSGPGIAGLSSAGLVILVIFGAWVVIRIRNGG